jgi:hypothetical protein
MPLSPTEPSEEKKGYNMLENKEKTKALKEATPKVKDKKEKYEVNQYAKTVP